MDSWKKIFKNCYMLKIAFLKLNVADGDIVGEDVTVLLEISLRVAVVLLDAMTVVEMIMLIARYT